jgi:hypothetical protein
MLKCGGPVIVQPAYRGAEVACQSGDARRPTEEAVLAASSVEQVLLPGNLSPYYFDVVGRIPS